MKLVYTIVMVLHAHAGSDRVAVMTPNIYGSLEQCNDAIEIIENADDNRNAGILNMRCVALPKDET